MTGTWINTAAILFGGALGLLFGRLLTENLRQTILAGLGLFTLGIAVSMFLETGNSLIVLGGLLIGALIGEGLQLDSVLNRWGQQLERRFNGSTGQESKFVRGFVTSSLLFCIGPMAILGAIQDGLNYRIIETLLEVYVNPAERQSAGEENVEPLDDAAGVAA